MHILPLAFAELQTDMTEVTSDISGQGGIPFRDYRCFSMCVLFPAQSSGEHPIIRHLDVNISIIYVLARCDLSTIMYVLGKKEREAK